MKWATRFQEQRNNYCIVVATNRLGELPAFMRAYDTCGDSKLPIFFSLDSAPDMRDEQGNLKYPDWHEDYEKVVEAAKACKNKDVFVLTRPQKEQFKHLAIAALRKKDNDSLANELEDGLWDELFKPGCGQNKDMALLYTIGSLALIVDDDTRPWQIEFRGGENFFRPKFPAVMTGREVRCDRPVYEVLSELDKPIEGFLQLGDERINIEDDPSVHRVLERRGSKSLAELNLERWGQDVISAVFSVLGTKVGAVIAQDPDTLMGACIDYSDTNEHTNITKGNMVNQVNQIRVAWFNREKARAKKPSRDYMPDLFQTTKPYSYSLELKDHDREPISADKVIRFVTMPLTGVPDYDAVDYLEEMLQLPQLEGEADRSLFAITHLHNHVTLYDYDRALHGGAVAIDNRNGTDPCLTSYRIDDIAWRHATKIDDGAVAKVPFALTHLRSPDRQGLAKAVFLEEIGAWMRHLLLNHMDEEGYYNGPTCFTVEDFKEIADSGKDFYNKILILEEEVWRNNTKLANVKALAEDFKREYCNFDAVALHKAVGRQLQHELEIYNKKREIWPILQEVAKELQDNMMVTNMKTGKEMSVREVLSNPEYTREFTINMMHRVICNTGLPKLENAWEYRNIPKGKLFATHEEKPGNSWSRNLNQLAQTHWPRARARSGYRGGRSGYY